MSLLALSLFLMRQYRRSLERRHDEQRAATHQQPEQAQQPAPAEPADCNRRH